MSKPQVFHLITRLLDGGAEDELIQSVTGMRQKYKFVVGHGASYKEKHKKTLSDEEIVSKEFPLLRHYNPVTMPFAVASIARYLRADEFDLVHTHSTEAGIVGRLAARLAGIPSVHTVHGVPFTDDRSALLNRFVLACERTAAQTSERIITNTPAITEEYLSRGIGTPDQYTTIYSGIDIEAFRDQPPATGLPGSRPRVLMVARLAEGKGFDVLFDAVEQSEQSFEVCIAGDGPLKGRLEADIERRGLGHRVHLLGYRSDVANLLAASDLFVLPSFREGMPRVITEAMAAGLPVVATDIAGIPDQVDDGETGYLIQPGEPAALASAIDRLLASPERQAAFGERAQAKASARFSIEETRRRLHEEYQQILTKD